MSASARLHVRTARLSPRLVGSDVLDVTRKTADELAAAKKPAPGAPFAPSGPLLARALEARQRAAARRASAADLFSGEDPARLLAAADAIEAAAWEAYVPAYREEMLVSYRRHRAAWDALLRRPRVVLACFCTDPERCHRRLLAGFLVRLGAVDEGETEGR